jgi:DNA-binding transcriptional MerR regulator
MNKKRLLIGRLARLAGLSTDTVRFYEREGLLPKAERTAANYRVYPPEALARLQFIRKAQALGLSLEETKRVLRVRDSGNLPCDFVIELAERRLREVEKQLGELHMFRESLRRYVSRWKRAANPDACAATQFCNLIEEVEIQHRPAMQRVVGRRQPKERDT